MYTKLHCKYRKLHKYKYQLVAGYYVALDIIKMDIRTEYLHLQPNGILDISKHYAWDGPSGPTIDTPNFIRGSLVHDALYQLMRLELLPIDYRGYADEVLRALCVEDGMSKFRAWYIYKAVRWFGGRAAKPNDKLDKVYYS